MNDPYRITPAAQPRPSASPFAPAPRPGPPSGGIALRVILWLGFTVCAVINIIGNSVGGPAEGVGMIAGIVAVASMVALIAHHYTRRRS
ncbi:hypothetical protein [Streptosporangium carneum]|uniref:Uncharacterized protein n=1 Tax=Streptosporangium carneum TaxID=47481 RepID=A0A9W6MEN3_9ACTN|nr:hypothetical protein [Streptosporangium carneum]GLK11155.1 hypothetical protein GCM10017600_45610 [Streptosporangium carneum]